MFFKKNKESSNHISDMNKTRCQNRLMWVSIIGIFIMISFLFLSLIPIYSYKKVGVSSYIPEDESIISAVDGWGIFPILIYSITGWVSIIFLFDFVNLSIQIKKKVILIFLLISVLVFIIYFVWSYTIIDLKDYGLFFEEIIIDF